MNQELQFETQNANEVDLDSLNIYDPTASTVVSPQFVVGVYVDENAEDKTYFVCKAVSGLRVLFELNDETAMLLQNSRGRDPKDDDDPLTHEDIQLFRANREFNLSAVRLGLVRPDLTFEQIEALPATVLSELAGEITATPETDDED